MSYSLVWSPKSEKKLAKLGKKLVVRIVKKMRKVEKSPFDFLEKVKEEEGFKVRVGNYRVFIDLEREKKEVHVLTVRHRRYAYKRK